MMMKCGQLLVIGVAILIGGCTTAEIPTAPEASSSSPAPVNPLDNGKTPPENGPVRIYAYRGPASYDVSWYTLGSQFRLYDNGGFTLVYPHVSYRGTYRDVDGVIAFAWEGWSVAGPWEASGTLQGDVLTVRYNIIMSLSDFEDAVYVRTE